MPDLKEWTVSLTNGERREMWGYNETFGFVEFDRNIIRVWPWHMIELTVRYMAAPIHSDARSVGSPDAP